MSRSRIHAATLTLLVIPLLCSAESESPSIAAARSLFHQLEELEHSFNPAVADLYADDALIKNRRIEPTGEVREIEIPGAMYKAAVAAAMPLARERGDISTYSNVGYEELEDGRVRITCTRFSKLKKYESPYVVVVENRGDSGWLVVEELVETRP
jgi:hypothetical protein